MRAYFLAELLKTKRSTLRKMILFVPLLCLLTAYGFTFLGGSDTRSLAGVTSLNHWALLWLPALITLYTGLIHNLENKSTQYKMIFGSMASLCKVWLAKNLLIALFTMASSILLILGITILEMAMGQLTFYVFNKYILIVFLCWFVTLWQIPLSLWLCQKVNYFVLLIINFFAMLELGASLAPKNNWWISPWSFSLRIQAPLLKMHPNGILLPPDSPLLNQNIIPVAVGLGVLLYVVMLYITNQSFQKQEVK